MSPPALSGNIALLLDLDGTLLEHEPHPQAVSVSPDLLRLMGDLRAACDGALALISGRAIADIDRLFAPMVLPAAGLHGIERRSAAGEFRDPQHARAAIDAAADRLAGFAGRSRGLGFEDKGLALALHYRRAPHLRSLAEAEMRAVSAGLGPGFELQMGKFVVEVRPRGRDKGSAIAEFAAEPPFAGRVPVFIGDDLSDETGFEVVNRLGGHSVKVGPGITRARWRLFDASAVRHWLSTSIENAMRAHAPGRTEARG